MRRERLYALIDPDSALGEIHEDNNKGFNILGALGSSAGIQADFIAAATRGPAPFHAQFTNASEGPFTTVLWDFGDGATSSEANPSHTYTRPGSYTVTLTIGGPGGSSTTKKTGYIEVAGSNLYLAILKR